jgi:hypothetical protein
MRLILILTLIVCQLNLIAQKISNKFDVLVSEDDFVSVSGKWEQRSSDNDFFITEEGFYVIKNKSTSTFSTSLHKPYLELSKCEIKASLKTDNTKKMESSIGVMINAKSDGSGAIVCELNSKNQYRVRKFLNGQWEILSFAGDNGWNNDEAIKRKAFNELDIKADNGVFDFYINSVFIFSFTDKKLVRGNVGIFASIEGAGKLEYLRIYTEGSGVKVSESTSTPTPKPEEKATPVVTESQVSDNEVVLLLKTKIDKQQKKIAELTKEYEKCRMDKSGDTSLEIKNIELTQLNETLLIEKGKLEIELRRAKEKLAEYELLKKSLEADENGDIVLKLNEIINREKMKNLELQQKINGLQIENQTLIESIKELKKSKR